MGRHFLAGLVGLLFVGGPTAALATPEANSATRDVDCLVVSMNLLDSTDPTIAKAAATSLFYWLGKLDGRDPSFDLENMVADATQSMTPERMRATALRCGAEMEKRGQSLREIGERLQRRGAQQVAPRSPS
jgi:hypothetical protein